MSLLIPLFKAYNSEKIETVVIELLRTGQIATGEAVEQFRFGLGELLGSQNVVTTDNMSSAMTIALKLSGVGIGDEVITSPFACMATNAPIATLGAKPRWVDVDPSTGLMSIEALQGSFTEKTKAVVLYHLAGYPARADIILKLCHSRGVKLIEDCDNALLATVSGAQVGSFGDFAVFSFYPNRQINTMDGGALICKYDEDFKRATLLKRFGIDFHHFRDHQGEINSQCDIPEIGWSAALSNVASAMGFIQLESVRSRVEKARSNAKIIFDSLENFNEISVVKPNENSVSSYWVLLVKCENRDVFLTYLKEKGVNASKLHYRNDSYSGFRVVANEQHLSGVESIQHSILAIPCGWWLTEGDIEYMVKIIKQGIFETKTKICFAV